MPKLLKDVAVGSIVKLNENGSPVEFYVACHDYWSELNGAGRTALIRKDYLPAMMYRYESGGTYDPTPNAGYCDSDYDGSVPDLWLNGEYLTRFDPNILTAIGTTATKWGAYRRDGTTAVKELRIINRAVFLPSNYEFGGNSGSGEGPKLSIASTLISDYDKRIIQAWSRSPSGHQEACVLCGSTSSTFTYTRTVFSSGGYKIVPMFTLPANGVSIADDGTVELLVELNGQDEDLGVKSIDFTVGYTATSLSGNDITVSEYVDDTLNRTHTVTSGSSHTANVDVDVLTPSTHTLKIVAEVDGGSTERKYTFTVPAVRILSDTEDLGDKISNFLIPYKAKTQTGEDANITEMVDGEIIDTFTVHSEVQQNMVVNTRALTEKDHVATIVAEAGGESVTVNFTFRIVPIDVSDGGTIQELQDASGQPVFPVTLAKAVISSTGEPIEQMIAHHMQDASTITGGTLAGITMAHDNKEYSTYQLRNCAILAAVPSSMASGQMALIYS